MKKSILRPLAKHSKLHEKTSGKTPGKPKSVADVSRKVHEVPADRGAREVESSVQGSE